MGFLRIATSCRMAGNDCTNGCTTSTYTSAISSASATVISLVMVEIGVQGGGSLAMWKAYLGEGARIIGIDIDHNCKEHEADGIEVFIGSQDDPKLLDLVLEKYPRIDIVLDDGSHIMKHMIATFEHFYPRIDKHGVYMVEDTHTCYWQDWGGGYKREGTFMEFVKDRLDDINALHGKGAFPVTEFTRSSQSISVYDSIVAFEKRPQGVRQAPVTEAIPAPPKPEKTQDAETP